MRLSDLLLRLPAAIEARMRSEVADGLVMRARLRHMAVDAEAVPLQLIAGERRAIRHATHNLVLERIESHAIESHKVLHPLVLLTQVVQ